MKKPVLIQNLKIGEVFVLYHSFMVYLRVRGGYRPGRGGELIKHMPYELAYRCTTTGERL